MKMNKIQQLSSWSSQLSGEVRHMQIALYTIGDCGNTERSQKHLRSAMGSGRKGLFPSQKASKER